MASLGKVSMRELLMDEVAAELYPVGCADAAVQAMAGVGEKKESRKGSPVECEDVD